MGTLTKELMKGMPLELLLTNLIRLGLGLDDAKKICCEHPERLSRIIIDDKKWAWYYQDHLNQWLYLGTFDFEMKHNARYVEILREMSLGNNPNEDTLTNLLAAGILTYEEYWQITQRLKEVQL